MNLRLYFSSFKGKLILLVLAAILLPLAGAGIILGNLLQQRVYTSFENELQVALETLELLLERWQEELANNLDRLADDRDLETRLRLEESGPAADSTMKEKITAQRKILDIGWLALFDLNRQLKSSSKFKSKNLALDFSALEKFQIGQNDSAYFLIFLTEVKQRGQVLGYLAGGLQLNSPASMVFLHDKKLRNFAFWLDGELIFTDLPHGLAAPVKKGMADFVLGGKSYKGMTRGRRYGNRQLQYALLVPVAHLQRDLNKLAGSLLAIIGALFVIFLILLAGLANKMMQPLQSLTDYARQLAAQKFSPRADQALAQLAICSQDEIGKLADSFLQMERQLQIYLRELAETTRAHEQIQSELRIAREIQMSMLPHLTPAWTQGKPFEIAAAMTPAEQVGGDFYDCFMLDAQHLCLVIGDVSDKGLPAALFMAMSKTLLRAVATLTRVAPAANIPPHEILTQVNRELCRDNDLFLFVTVFLGVIDTQTGALQYSCGGHHPPYLFSAGRGLFALNHQHSAPLGVKMAARYETAEVALQPGDGLFFYTDGVIEARNGGGELYSEARLVEFLKQHQTASAEEMTQQIAAETKKFSGATPPHDDMTVLVVKYRTA